MIEGYYDHDIAPRIHEDLETHYFPVGRSGMVGAVIEEPDYPVPPEEWRSFAFFFCRPEQNPDGMFVIWPSDGPADDSVGHDELLANARDLQLIDKHTDPDWGGMMKRTRYGWQMFEKSADSPVKIDAGVMEELSDAVEALRETGYADLAATA